MKLQQIWINIKTRYKMIQAFNKSGKSLTDKFLISWALMKILDQIYFIFNSHFKIYYYNNR